MFSSNVFSGSTIAAILGLVGEIRKHGGGWTKTLKWAARLERFLPYFPHLNLSYTGKGALIRIVTKAGQKADLQRLTTPIDGVVQQLAVHTVGGIVTPAQDLLIVVPQDHPVEVAAQVENKDVGFVRKGQIVEVKVETFPFTLYGTIPGKVLSVSDDAASIEKSGLSIPRA